MLYWTKYARGKHITERVVKQYAKTIDVTMSLHGVRASFITMAFGEGRSSHVGAGCRLVKGPANDEALSEAVTEPS